MSAIDPLFEAVRLATADGYVQALSLARQLARPDEILSRQSQYARFAKKIRPYTKNGMPVIRLAVLASSTVDHLVACLEFWLLIDGIRLEAHIAPFGSWRQELSDPHSSTSTFRPDFIWILLTTRDLELTALPGSDAPTCSELIQARQREIRSYLDAISLRFPFVAVLNTLPSPARRPLGNLAISLPWSPSALCAGYNANLPNILPPGGIILDLAHLAAMFGLDRWEDERFWHHSKHAFSPDATGMVAAAVARILGSARGSGRKCLVLDLDNTLWGGVVGDDGTDAIRIGSSGGAAGEAFAGFQLYIKALSERGVILAVCSRNDPVVARSAFADRAADMPLRLDHFASFHAGWGDKAESLRAIARELNIGLDSLVFFDDNPAERARVREALPAVAVPEAPDDPSDFIRTLDGGRWFETVSLSGEDALRTKAYQANVQLQALSFAGGDVSGFLAGLDMAGSWGRADHKTIPRIAQLVNKTNQFNLTTSRLTEAEILNLTLDQRVWVGWFALRDRFANHGIVSVAILRFSGEVATIDPWVMSCRVFARGFEDAIFGILLAECRRRGARRLEGLYRPSAKNEVVSGLYSRLGGRLSVAESEFRHWIFDVDTVLTSVSSHITLTESLDSDNKEPQQ
jgi:FkbH-like protein